MYIVSIQQTQNPYKFYNIRQSIINLITFLKTINTGAKNILQFQKTDPASLLEEKTKKHNSRPIIAELNERPTLFLDPGQS